jgi:aspartyl/asparaginyl beta-hydroxylase (cupin superfamily)
MAMGADEANGRETLGYKVTRAIGLGITRLFAAMITLVVGRRPVLDPNEIPELDDLRRHWKVVRDEALAVVSDGKDVEVQTYFRQQAPMMEGRKWRSYAFLVYGTAFKEHLDACPRTAALIKAVPRISSATLSILPPNSRLVPHHGPYKGVLRYLLALVVPSDEEKCGLVVDGRTFHWKEGEGILFDDTFLHESYNRSDEYRIVLFLDLIRPLPFPLNLLNKALFGLLARSEYIRAALEQAEKMEELHFERKRLAF